MTAPRYMLQVAHRFATLERGEAIISAITYGELLYGAEKHVERERLLEGVMRLIEFLPVESVPPSAAALYGQVRAALERRGEVIGNQDLWIAAHALAAGLTLVTNNEREFRRVPGLQVENWAAM